MYSLEREAQRARRLADEHTALADYYATRDARRARGNRLKATAWQEYANLLPDLLFDN